MWVFRLLQQYSWDLCSSGTKYRVTRRPVLLSPTEVVPPPTWPETSAVRTFDTLDSHSMKLCWQSHAKIYKTLDKKLWTHSTDHKVVQEVCMLYTKKNTVCYASSQWLDASVIFVQDVLETVYANTYFSDIMILEAEYCHYFYIYCMFKSKKHLQAQSYCRERCGCNNPSNKKCVSFIQGRSTYQAVTTLHLSYKKPIC